MEESKTKNQKKQIPDSTEAYEQMKALSIPIKKAVFHATVTSFSGEPEFAFYTMGAKPSRTAKMWLSQAGLICEQYKKDVLMLSKIVPSSNIKDMDVL